jgi:hypothetical protein
MPSSRSATTPADMSSVRWSSSMIAVARAKRSRAALMLPSRIAVIDCSRKRWQPS